MIKGLIMRNFLFFLLLIVCIYLISCSGEREVNEGFSVEIVDGVELVHNTSKPAFPNKTVQFEEQLSIDGEDLEGNIVLYNPGSLAVGPNNSIYIFDNDDYAIKVFSSEGEFIRPIGRKGQGPGEFQSMAYLFFLPSGRLFALDIMSTRISLFDPSGKFLESHQWQKPMGRPQYVVDSGLVISEYDITGDPSLMSRRLFMKKYDFSGNVLKDYGEFLLPEFKLHRETGRSFMISIPGSPHSLFAADQNRELLYHCINNKYLIEVFDKSGTIIRKIDRPYEALPFTKKNRDEFLDRYKNSRNEAMKKMAENMPFPDTQNVVQSLFVDDRGYLCVMTNEKREEKGGVLYASDIFDLNGCYESRVWIERTYWTFAKDSVFKIAMDEETGSRILKKYRVIWSE